MARYAQVLSLAAVAIAALVSGELTAVDRPSVERLVAGPDLEALRAAERMLGEGGDLGLVMVQTEPGSRSTAATADAIAAIEAEAQTLPHVLGTISSRSRPRLRLAAGPPPRLHVEHGAPEVGTSDSHLDAFLRPKADTQLIVLRLAPALTGLEPARQFVQAADALARTTSQAQRRVSVISTAHIRTASWREANHSLWWTAALALLAALLVPAWAFRSMWVITCSATLALLTVASTLLLHRWLVGPLHPLELLLVPLVIAMATLDAFHLVQRTQSLAGPRPAAAWRAQRSLWWPCVLTSLTTAIGLLALAAQAQSPMLRTFGIWGAVGTAIAFAWTFALGPWLLRGLPRHHHPSLGAWLRRCGRFAMTRPIVVIVAWTLLLATAVPWALQIQPETHYPRIFTADQPLARRLADAETLLGAELAPIDLLVQPMADRRTSPEALVSAGLGLHYYVRTIPEVRFDYSPLLLIDELIRQAPRNRALLRRPAIQAALLTPGPPNSGDAARSPALPAGGWLRTDGPHAARITLFLTPTDFQRRREILQWIRRYADRALPPFELVFGGNGYIYHHAEYLGLQGLMAGSAVGLLMLAALLAVALRRLGPWWVAMVVNAVPLAIVAGLMGAFAIPWSLGLLGLPVVLFSIAVDDSIHLLWPLRRRRGVSPTPAVVLRSLARTGPALVATTAMLTAAMASTAASGLVQNRDVGLLTATGLLIALLADVTLLPALVAIATGKRRQP